METTRKKKMADSRFAILIALFLPNKELFTNFVMHENTKTGDIIFSVTQNRTCELPQFCVILMTMLSCKLKKYIIPLQFVILLNVL